MYHLPLLYDIAFSYRDYPAEVNALTAWYEHAKGKGKRPASVLELAAGPADHAVEFARRGARAAALDLAPSMCEYARKNAAKNGVELAVHCADMIDFAIADRFDLAITMVSSLEHVYTVDDMARHLRSVARHLAPEGLYIVELPHPIDYLGEDLARAGSHWTQERDGITVETTWGHHDVDPYDPITQIVEASVEMRVRGPEGEEVHRDLVRMKNWTACEFEAVVKLSGAFELAARHGAFKADAPFDNTRESWRMICVMRKLEAAR